MTFWCHRENGLKRSKDAYQSQNLLKIWPFATDFSFYGIILNTKKFCWHEYCMKSDVFLKDFLSNCEQICWYLQVPLSSNVSIWFLKLYQGLIQKEKVHIDCEKGAQVNILANKMATQWWLNIIVKESKQTLHNIYFLFSCCYVHIMFLIWSKNWNCT